MKKIFSGLVLIVTPVFVMAQIPVYGPEPQHPTVEQLEELRDQMRDVQLNKQKLNELGVKDNYKFCYFDDKAFSEGATHAGKVCKRTDDSLSVTDFQEKISQKNRNPLKWVTL